MAQPKRENLKRRLLIVYVVVGVFLIGAILVNGLLPPSDEQPGFYRPTFELNEANFATQTVIATNPPPTIQHTPGPNHPTAEPSAFPTIED